MSLLLPALLCVSCTSAKHQTIVVKDQAGKPVTNATISPAPALVQNLVPGLGAKTTDSSGRIEIYDVKHGSGYTISAPGYEKKEIRFPRRDNRVHILRRADETSPPAPNANAETD